MPTLRRLCSSCRRTVVTSGRCADCSRAARRARADRTGDAFYSARPWRAVRAIALAASPRCACGRPATQADHIIRREERPDLALALENIRTWCASCHSKHGANVGRFSDGHAN